MTCLRDKGVCCQPRGNTNGCLPISRPEERVHNAIETLRSAGSATQPKFTHKAVENMAEFAVQKYLLKSIRETGADTC